MEKFKIITAISLILANGLTVGFAQGQDGVQDTNDYAKRPQTTCEPSFKLSDFKLPDYRRRALMMDYSLNNDFTARHYSNEQFDEEGKELQNQFNLRANISYSDIFYTRKLQRETYISSNVGFNTNYSKRQNPTIEPFRNNHIDYLLNASFRQNNRHYFNEKLFIGYNPFIGYGFNGYNNVSKGSTPTINKQNNFSQALNLGIGLEVGYGRIEQVGDARHAIYIFDALARQSLTSTSKSKEDIIRLAELIAKLKNKRFLDSRHRKIYELEALDSFLFANSLVTISNARYFTTLQDFWGYGNESRLSGTRWSLFATPGYRFNVVNYKHTTTDITGYEHLDYKSVDNRNVLIIRLGINLAYEKPINLYWQNSISSTLEYYSDNIRTMYKNIYMEDSKSIDYNFAPKVQYSFTQRFSYYPTTRTSLYAGYDFRYQFIFKKDDKYQQAYKYDHFEHVVNAGISGGMSYYFSPQLQLNLGVSLSYYFTGANLYMYGYNPYDRDWYKSKNSNLFLNFNASLNYTFY